MLLFEFSINFDLLVVYRSKQHNPYVIPVGGSNVTGVWGYIEAFKELMDQVSTGVRPHPEYDISRNTRSSML